MAHSVTVGATSFFFASQNASQLINVASDQCRRRQAFGGYLQFRMFEWRHVQKKIEIKKFCFTFIACDLNLNFVSLLQGCYKLLCFVLTFLRETALCDFYFHYLLLSQHTGLIVMHFLPFFYSPFTCISL